MVKSMALFAGLPPIDGARPAATSRPMFCGRRSQQGQGGSASSGDATVRFHLWPQSVQRSVIR
jgi:hypothetical protein